LSNDIQATQVRQRCGIHLGVSLSFTALANTIFAWVGTVSLYKSPVFIMTTYIADKELIQAEILSTAAWLNVAAKPFLWPP
jgi:hypothetical protein